MCVIKRVEPFMRGMNFTIYHKDLVSDKLELSEYQLFVSALHQLAVRVPGSTRYGAGLEMAQVWK